MFQCSDKGRFTSAEWRNREIKEENVVVFIVCKENVAEQLQNYCKEFERFEETLE